jgi:hypothetical protein
MILGFIVYISYQIFFGPHLIEKYSIENFTYRKYDYFEIVSSSRIKLKVDKNYLIFEKKVFYSFDYPKPNHPYSDCKQIYDEYQKKVILSNCNNKAP